MKNSTYTTRTDAIQREIIDVGGLEPAFSS